MSRSAISFLNSCGFARGCPVASLLLLAVGILLPIGVRAADPPSVKGASKSPAADVQVVVQEPKIYLIDRAILSCSRLGIIDTIAVREGDLVKAGDLIVQLRDEVPRAAWMTACEEAENDIEILYANAATLVAEAEYRRAQLANKKVPHAFPDIEVDRLRLTAEKSILQIEQAKHQLSVLRMKRDEAWEVLQTFRIEARMDGFISKVHKVPGEAVREGDALVEVVNTDRVKVEGYVHVNESVQLKRGQLVKVRIDIEAEDLPLEKEEFHGHVMFVDLSTRTESPLIKVWAEVQNRNNMLREGLDARMVITPGQMVPEAQIKKSSPTERGKWQPRNKQPSKPQPNSPAPKSPEKPKTPGLKSAEIELESKPTLR